MRNDEQLTFTTHGGATLAYRHWPAVGQAADRAIVLFHRGHEHSGRMQHVVDELNLPDVPMFAWDARGHGHSPGERGFSPSMGASIKDVDCFMRHVSEQSGVALENMTVIAQSVGAVLVAAWVHDYAPRIRAMVLASPAFKVKLYVPLARAGLALMHKLRGNFFVNSYVKAKFLTHDPQRIASYDSDPLISRAISVNILLGLYDTARRVVEDAQAIATPTLLLISGADFVVHHPPQHEFFARLGAQIKEKIVLPGYYHDTLGERDRGELFARIRNFILQRYAEPPASLSLLDAHLNGHTKDEADILARPLPALAPKALAFGFTKWFMRSIGQVSEGMRLGVKTGFDSGSTLDYVYRNEARGVTPFGRLVDRNYLDAIGWRGIRVRKVHAEQLIARAATRLREQGMPVHIADIAAGHGRYVLEAVERLDATPQSVLLRDYSEINVRDGRKLIAQKNMLGFARFELANAFEASSVAAMQPPPTLAVVSGLYELFPDNTLIRASLGGLARAVAPGGYLVYTNQPWHPQLEFIARTLTSHRDGGAWVMRRRTQAEMDQLVRHAGFDKVDQLTDDWGIFTVSLARRRAA